jgi:hypothetical protein
MAVKMTKPGVAPTAQRHPKGKIRKEFWLDASLLRRRIWASQPKTEAVEIALSLVTFRNCAMVSVRYAD